MRVEGPEQDLTYKIIGCAMRVHNALGPGLKEVNYHRALSVEMQKDGLTFEEEKPIHIEIDGTFAGFLYIDHLVNESVSVEEKAFSHMLTDEESAQVITYQPQDSKWGCSSTSADCAWSIGGSFRRGS